MGETVKSALVMENVILAVVFLAVFALLAGAVWLDAKRTRVVRKYWDDEIAKQEWALLRNQNLMLPFITASDEAMIAFRNENPPLTK